MNPTIEELGYKWLKENGALTQDPPAIHYEYGLEGDSFQRLLVKAILLAIEEDKEISFIYGVHNENYRLYWNLK